jgi:hypothetical protein
MILEGNMFSAQPAAGGDAPVNIGTTDSTNVYDLGIARDIGSAVTEDLDLLIQVITAFTSGGSATLQVALKGAPDNGSGAPGSYSIMYQSDAIPVANLVQGYRFLMGGLLSQNPSSLVRFLKVSYIIGTAAMTAGAIVAGFTPALQYSPNYARGYTA